MKTFTLIIKSKNKISKDNFILVLNNFNLNKLYIINTLFQKKIKKNKFTILKSPHVNKKAQEQFEIRFFKQQLTISSIKNFKYLILLKKLNFNLFSDVNVILKHQIKQKSNKRLSLKIFIPENFKFNKFSNFKHYNLKLRLLKKKSILSTGQVYNKLKLFLRILDSSGEISKIYV